MSRLDREHNIKDIKEIFLLMNNIKKRKIEYLYISDEEDEKDIHFKRKRKINEIF